MKRKIAFNDLKVKSIFIEATMVKPGRNKRGIDRNIPIQRQRLRIKKTLHVGKDPRRSLTVYIDIEAWMKAWHGISATDIGSVPSELFSKFTASFYKSPEDVVIKALDIE